jgi:osmoprotectant transport system ATP-binding protein
MSHHAGNAIEFAGVHYRVDGSRPLVFDLNLAVASGEVFMLLGRSGSGKTTTLKLVNRLLAPSQGTVYVNGTPNGDWDVIKLRRRIGYAIQEVGLFPHYNAVQNVGLIPKLEGRSKQEVRARVEELLRIVGLPPEQFAMRYPNQLSGGERQRLGLARALAADPPILLMDEPFGALDPLTRAQLQTDFRQLQQSLRKTVVFVTHDVAEALLLGDRIALMDAGRLRDVFTPREFVNSTDPHVKEYLDAYRLSHPRLESEA